MFSNLRGPPMPWGPVTKSQVSPPVTALVMLCRFESAGPDRRSRGQSDGLRDQLEGMRGKLEDLGLIQSLGGQLGGLEGVARGRGRRNVDSDYPCGVP